MRFMKREYVPVIEYDGREVFRGEPTDLTRARIDIASWKVCNPDKDRNHLRCWLETMSMPPYLPPVKTKRWEGKSEQEKTTEKYLK